jgi:hypothetical protein
VSRPPYPPIRSALATVPTLGRVGVDGFLALGAAVGAVGWSTTALLTARPDPVGDPELAAMAVWFGLVGVMVGVGTLATPDAVRFSRPLLAWGGANGTATLVSTLALVGVLPSAVHLYAWPLAGLVGYAATARFVGRRNARDARLYGTAAVLEAATLGLALAGGPPVLVFALLGVCHALPLALVAGTRTARAPYVLVGGYLFVLATGTWAA